MTDWASRLADVARRPPRIVCLPDFYVDHFVQLPSLARAVKGFSAIHKRGGGAWTGVRQRLQPGGNATNTARALAALGAKVSLIARTDAFGKAFAAQALRDVDVGRMRGDGELGATVALEFSPGPVNVMMNDPGSVAHFGPADLEPEDKRLIESADGVFVGNWSQSLNHGTRIAQTVLRWAARSKTQTFLDTGDPTSRRGQIPELMRRVLTSRRLDVLGVNEVELRAFAGRDGILEAGHRLSRRIHATLDVHTRTFSASWGRHGFVRVPAHRVHARRATGAGDVWNAGDVIGHLVGLEPQERLRLANATAALYVSGDSGEPPSARRLIGFLRHPPPSMRSARALRDRA